ncbi:hypothetical protein [Amycolatopsis arida]|uniref:hypothetical protein n=1 Tax=Amycolatopsis arida TaxID=587909 RepID=UPI00106696EC|nr:hypothetical protein [Amycolatopsis arida]
MLPGRAGCWTPTADPRALGQFVVGARTLTPRLAAGVGLPCRTFARRSAPSAAVWGAAAVLVGHLSGEAYERVGTVLVLAGLVVLGTVPLRGRSVSVRA